MNINEPITQVESINDKAMAFTMLVERYMRGNEFGVAPVDDTEVVDAMYSLRAAIVKAAEAVRG